MRSVEECAIEYLQQRLSSKCERELDARPAVAQLNLISSLRLRPKTVNMSQSKGTTLHNHNSQNTAARGLQTNSSPGAP
eukprot:6203921-Pleurochrysis_carterae.AAC.3